MPRTRRQAPDPGASRPEALAVRALERRAGLLARPGLETLRCLHGAADGTPGLFVDRYGDVLVAQLHEQTWTGGSEAARPIVAALAERLGATATYLKVFPRDRSAALARLEAQHRAATPWIGRPAEAELTVLENGVPFAVRPYDGYSCGLFLEQRENRGWVRERSAGLRVLNLFAYTCGFGVVAALGGARQTVNVDVSKRYLEWGRRNYTLSGLSLAKDDAMFVASDALDYLGRARRQERQFDLVVLDPPSFGRDRRGRAFALADALEQLVAESCERLSPGGYLLVCTNHRGISLQRLEQAVRAAGRTVGVLEPAPLPPDFAGDADFAKLLRCRLAE